MTRTRTDPALWATARIIEKISSLINYEGPHGCWLWTGSTVPEGYGKLVIGKRTKMAHRLVYEQHRGAIPDGLHLDHLCRNRGCVNPDHLEPVTCRENILRGVGPCAINARKTHCKWGHELSGDNLFVYDNGTKRRCRACDSRRHRERRQSA